MVRIKMAIAAGPDEVTDLELALLRKHVGQQRVRRDIERHPKEHVCRALIQLARQAAARDVELEERMTGLERHSVEVRDVPRADDDAARVGIRAQLLDDTGDLVDVAPIGRRP